MHHSSAFCFLIMLNNSTALKFVSLSYQMLLHSIENMNILNKTNATYDAATSYSRSLKTFKSLSEGLKPFSERKMMQFACINSNYHHHFTFYYNNFIEF